MEKLQEIKTSTEPGAVSSSSFQENFDTCQFCSEKAKYKCPKCNAPYCSLVCYKCANHLKCSESFYRKLVEDELKDQKCDHASKKKMIEILQRVNQNSEEECFDTDDNSDLEAQDDISDRLDGIDLNDPDAIWSKLTKTEQNEFFNLVQSGKTEDIIPPFKPWWEDVKHVEELKEGGDRKVPTFMENCPSIVTCPLLSSIMKKSPSSCVPFNILNVLAAYAWVVRLFNGDHHDNCKDASEALLTLCPVLSKEANYESAEVAVNVPKMESQNHSWLRESEEFNATVQKDVRRILQGPTSSCPSFFIAAALSDIHALFVSCKLTKKEKPKSKGAFSASFGGTNEEIEKIFLTRETVKLCILKIEFFLSYVKEYPNSLCKS